MDVGKEVFEKHTPDNVGVFWCIFNFTINNWSVKVVTLRRWGIEKTPGTHFFHLIKTCREGGLDQISPKGGQKNTTFFCVGMLCLSRLL